MDIAFSVHGVPIRLTEERWDHIIESRDDMVEYREDCLRVIENPDFVLQGGGGALHALKAYGRKRFLQVIYRETSDDDGFVITAYFVQKLKGRVVWRR